MRNPAQTHDKYLTRVVIVVIPGNKVVAIAVKGRRAPSGSMLPDTAARGSQAERTGNGNSCLNCISSFEFTSFYRFYAWLSSPANLATNLLSRIRTRKESGRRSILSF
jgi:hypothetical protein